MSIFNTLVFNDVSPLVHTTNGTIESVFNCYVQYASVQTISGNTF